MMPEQNICKSARSSTHGWNGSVAYNKSCSNKIGSTRLDQSPHQTSNVPSLLRSIEKGSNDVTSIGRSFDVQKDITMSGRKVYPKPQVLESCNWEVKQQRGIFGAGRKDSEVRHSSTDRTKGDVNLFSLNQSPRNRLQKLSP